MTDLKPNMTNLPNNTLSFEEKVLRVQLYKAKTKIEELSDLLNEVDVFLKDLSRGSMDSVTQCRVSNLDDGFKVAGLKLTLINMAEAITQRRAEWTAKLNRLKNK